MNLQNCIYDNLVSLGVDMQAPPDFAYSKADNKIDLVYGLLRKKKDEGMLLFLAHYRSTDDGNLVAEPGVVLLISHEMKTACALSWRWGKAADPLSSELDVKVKAWLDELMAEGHRFRFREEVIQREDLDLTPAHDLWAQLKAIGKLLNVGIGLLKGNIIRLDYGDVAAIIFQDGHYEVFHIYLSEERERLEDVLAGLEDGQ